MIDDNLVKASVAAKQLGKSSTTIRRMIQDGRLSGQKNGTRYLVNRASLEQFEATGDGRIEQTELKSNTETIINSTITEQNETENVDLDSVENFEDEEISANTARYECLSGEIQFRADAFFEKCKEFPFDYLSVFARYIDYANAESEKGFYELEYKCVIESVKMIELLGDCLEDIIVKFYDHEFFGYDMWYWDEGLRRRVYKDIMWRLELRAKENAVPAYCYPFRCFYDDENSNLCLLFENEDAVNC